MSIYDSCFDPFAENNTAAYIYRLAAAGGRRILDLGSGTAVVSSRLAREEHRDVTCVDIDREQLAIAESRGVGRVIEADLDDLGWVQHIQGEKFDVIILADVLEHLREPARLLQQLVETGLLDDGGFAVVSIPNAAHESIIAELLSGGFYYTETGLLDRTHIRFFTLDSFIELAEGAGWSVSSVDRTTRTIEQTFQKPRAFDIPEDLRRAIRQQNPESRVYQYVFKLEPVGADKTRETLRRQVEQLQIELIDLRAAGRAAEEELSRVQAARDELAAENESLRSDVARLTTEAFSVRDALESTREEVERLHDLLIEREKELAAQRSAIARQRSGQLERIAEAENLTRSVRRQLEEAQAEVRELKSELKEARAALRAAERRLEQMTDSFTWKAGRVIKVAVDPLIKVANLVRSRRRPVEASQAESSTPRVASPVSERPDPGWSLDYRTDVNEEVRADYQRAVDKRRFAAQGGPRLAMAVYTLDLSEGRGDIYVAVGLGRYLERLGYDVLHLSREQWYEVPEDPDIYVALLPSINALQLPSSSYKIAWVRNETKNWAQNPSLNGFDLILASSRASAAEIQRVFAGPVDIMPIGVDLELFSYDPEDASDRRGVVSTVNQWGRERDLFAALKGIPIRVPLALFGQARGLSPELQSYWRGPINFFELPSVYRQARIVLDDFNHTTAPYGNVNSRIFEAIAAGALPITNSSRGLKDLGLSDVPVYRSPSELQHLMEQFHQNDKTRLRIMDGLRRAVVEQHSFEQRARQFNEVVQEIRRERRASERRPIVAFFPDYRATNPYQRMLYDGASVIPVPLRDIFEPELTLVDPQNTILHLHWTAPILGPAKSSTDALRRLERFVATLERVSSAGVRILWTVHNAMPHECTYEDVELVLRQELANRADAIHVMSEDTIQAIEEFYALPSSKVHVIPHASYLGVYPDGISPERAREELGLPEDDIVLLCLGGIRPYKGVDVLLDAFENALKEDRSLRLVIAGRLGKFPGAKELENRAKAHPRISCNFNMIADEDLQVFFKASDAVVLPYRRVLNSGSILLAFSFGRPVIVPRLGGLPDVDREGLGLSYGDPESADELSKVLLRARELRHPSYRRNAIAWAERYTGADMAEEFGKLVRKLIDRG